MVCLCGGMPGRQVIKVHSIRCVTVKRSVRPCLVIERQVARQSLLRGAEGLVGVQIHFLVFDALPQPLDKHVVAPTTFPVHTDLDAVVFQHPREFLAGELTPLIGVEDLRRAIAGQGVLDRFETEVGGQRVGEPPCQYPATRPVQHGKQIDKATLHRDVGDVCRPHVIRASDRQMAQEIGIDLVGGMPLAGVRLAIQGLNTHAPHQRGDMPPANRMASFPQEVPQHASSGKWIGQMKRVNLTHQR